MGILIDICFGFLLRFSLGKKPENQEGLVDGFGVGSLLGVVLGVIVGT